MKRVAYIWFDNAMWANFKEGFCAVWNLLPHISQVFLDKLKLCHVQNFDQDALIDLPAFISMTALFITK